MKSFVKVIATILSIQLMFSCNNLNQKTLNPQRGIGCEYATNIDIIVADGIKSIVVRESWDPKSKSGDTIKISDNCEKQPKRVVCMSTSHIAYLTSLGLEDYIVGVSGSRYISNPAIREKINNGEIADIGFEASLNYELLISLKPDIVFSYGISGENNQYLEKIRQFGIRVIAVGDYLEEHPLGKLEYLKLFGEIFGIREKADSIYNSSKTRYLNLKQLTEGTPNVKVLINAPWKEVWYIPGGRSYMSTLINDAGGEIILSDKEKHTIHTYNLEKVYSRALEAEYWLNPNNYSTIEELELSNPLFKNIPCLKKGLVYNNTFRNTSDGGSDFWERGVVEPDIILRDLIKILHPELGREWTLKYYMKLK